MPEAISDAAFREALAHFASGVTIVTARADGLPAGFTASAFTSVSRTPPLILVCVNHGASAYEAVVGSAAFGVSVLAERQAWIAEQFAKSGVDRFRDVPWSAGGGGVPLIDGAIVHLECKQHATHEAGDHTLLVGEVLRASVSAGRPLLHFARRFGGFAPDAPPSNGAPHDGVSKGSEV